MGSFSSLLQAAAPRDTSRAQGDANREATLSVNVFDDLPAASGAEVVTTLLASAGARIERIVSNGQATPLNSPYNQDRDEWVLLLRGAAGLWIDGEPERTLWPGDYVFIPAHRLHRVTWTRAGEPTVWLAIHLT